MSARLTTSPARRAEIFEQRVLLRGQRDVAAADRARAGCACRASSGPTIEPLGQQRLAAAADQRAQPRQQLAEVERLDQIVVGAAVEPLDARLDRVARGQHQDRHGAARLANRAADREAVAPRQHHVEDDGVVVGRARPGRSPRRRRPATSTAYACSRSPLASTSAACGSSSTSSTRIRKNSTSRPAQRRQFIFGSSSATLHLCVPMGLVCSSLCSASSCQSASAGVAVTGVVQDQTGSILPGATVDLVGPSGAVAQTAVTDGAGRVPLRAGRRRASTSFAPVSKGSSRRWRSCGWPTARRRATPRPRSRGADAGDHGQQRLDRSRHRVEQQRRRDHHRPEHARERCRSSTTTSSRRCRSFSTPDRSATAA